MSDSGKHIEESSIAKYSNVVGTAVFASINVHKGNEVTRRDDLESLVYSLVYLLNGTLPWKTQDHILKKKERQQMILSMKEEFISNHSDSLPKELVRMLEMVKKLGFSDEPDYKKLKLLL